MSFPDTIHGLGIRIRKYRQAKGWTQGELAFRVGVEQPRIAEIENGRGNPTIRTVFKISEVLEVRLRDLVDPE